jgi:DNA polymerase-3 subunit delta'
MPLSSWPVTGHTWAVDQLRRALKHGRMRHAYLFTGPASIGKTTLARALAAALNCTGESRPCGECRACKLILKGAHPDVMIVEPEGHSLKIDQVRELQQTLALRPFEGRYRVAILRRFHEAVPNAADALLKTLEEPAPNAVLILTADTPDLLLPTIISRCQPLHLRPLPIQTVHEALVRDWEAAPEIAQMLAQLSGGRLGWAIRALQDPAELDLRNAALDTLEAALQGKRRERFALVEGLPTERSQLTLLLDFWQGYWRDTLLLASGSQSPITNFDRAEHLRALAKRVGRDAAQRALESTRRTLGHINRNVNARLALEVLMLDYPAT